MSGSVDYVEGLEGPVKFADLTMAGGHGGNGLNADLRLECAA